MKSQDQYTLDDASIFTLQGSSLAIQEKLDPGSIAVAKFYIVYELFMDLRTN